PDRYPLPLHDALPISAEASVDVDIRVLKLRDAPAPERQFRALRPYDKRCTLTVEGGLNRPPMERSAGIVKLFLLAQKLGREIGRSEEHTSELQSPDHL